MTSDHLGLVAVLALVLFGLGMIQKSRLSTEMKAILSVALLFRVVGAGARMFVLFDLYGGVGDAVGYFDRSMEYAEDLRSFSFGWIIDPEMRYNPGSPWWGTQFVHVPATLVLAVLGPSMSGGFIAFSLLAFLGLIGCLVAFRRAFPELSGESYGLWLFLFPSLWFWPSSIGKEALVICGLGVAVAGFVGRGRHPSWIPLLLGLLLVFAVRPQLAAVLVVAMAGAEWVRRGSLLSAGGLIRGIPLLILGAWVVYRASSAVGLSELSVDEIDTFITESPTRRAEGSTSVDQVPVGLVGVPMALINILFRPLPWEATNPQVLMSAVEIWVLWGVAFLRRSAVLSAIRQWRTNRLIGLSVLFVLAYSVALGLMVVNVGIIARQRIFLFPFLFVLLWAGGRESRQARSPWHHRTARSAAPSDQIAPTRPAAGQPG